MDTYAFVDGEAILGFITIHPSSRYLGGGIYIVNLNVAQTHRKQKIGEQLMRNALAQYCSYGNVLVTLDVSKTNTAATNLYKKLSFQITDLPSANGDTDYVMTSRLNKVLGIIKTPRLRVQPIALEDTPQLGKILRSEIVNKTYMVPDLTEDAAISLAKKIAMLSADHTRYVRGVYLDNTLIGFINDVETKDNSIELGWVIHPSYHNNGYATEAVRAAIADLFNRGYSAVIAGAFEENTASLRVMQKSGMQLQDLTEEIEYRGKTHHCVYYAIRRNR